MNFILDNLIAAKKAKPMIVVMEQGYADAAASPGVADRPAARRRGPAGRPGPTSAACSARSRTC